MNRKTATLATVLALGASLSITGPASAGASLGLTGTINKPPAQSESLHAKLNSLGAREDAKAPQAGIVNGAVRWSNGSWDTKTYYAKDGGFVLGSNYFGAAGQAHRKFLHFQKDGNLVAYDHDGRVLWQSRTVGADRFAFQADTNAVIYKGGKAVWWTGRHPVSISDQKTGQLHGLTVAFGWPQSIWSSDQIEYRSLGRVYRYWRMAS